MYPNLIAELKRYSLKYEDIANCLEIGMSAISDKMNGKTDFKVSEIKKIKDKFFPDCSLDYLCTTKDELIKVFD